MTELVETDAAAIPTSRIGLTETARRLLAEAEQWSGPSPDVSAEITVLYEVMGLVSKRFGTLGTSGYSGEPAHDRTLRAGSLNAGDHLTRAMRALELAWLAVHPIRQRTSLPIVVEPKEAA